MFSRNLSGHSLRQPSSLHHHHHSCLHHTKFKIYVKSYLNMGCLKYIYIYFPAKGRTNLELREKFILPEGTTQVMASFRYRGRRSRPSSRGASPNRSTSSQSCPVPVNPVTTSTPKVRGSSFRWKLLSFSIRLHSRLDHPSLWFVSSSLVELESFSSSVICMCFFHLVILVVFFYLKIHVCLLICHCSPDSPTHNPQLW